LSRMHAGNSNRRIITQITVALVLSLVLINSIIYFVVTRQTRESLINEAVSEARFYASVLKPRIISEMTSHTASYVHQTLRNVYSKGRIKSLSLYNKKGKLIFTSDPTPRENAVTESGVSTVLTSGKEEVTFLHNHSNLYVYQPLRMKEYGLYGVLSIGIKGIRAVERSYEKALSFMAIATAIILCIALVIYFVVKYFLIDAADKMSAQVYRLETEENIAQETDYHRFGYFFNVTFRISHLVKDLRQEIETLKVKIRDYKKVTAQQKEFLNAACKEFIPKSFRHSKLDAEVKYIPYSDSHADFAYIYPSEEYVYMVMGHTGREGYESIAAINIIGNIIKECLHKKRLPNDMYDEIVKGVKENIEEALFSLLVVVIDHNTNSLRHYGNMAHPLILWKKSDKSFMLLKPKGASGVIDSAEVEGSLVGRAALSSGDKIIMCNQNLINIKDILGKRLGVETLMDMLLKNIESSSMNLKDILSLELQKYCENNAGSDIFFIIAEYKGIEIYPHNKEKEPLGLNV